MEQQRKEQERLAQLERAEQERKERERQEQERKRQLELEKQLEKQRELERQREEERRKEIERREVNQYFQRNTHLSFVKNLYWEINVLYFFFLFSFQNCINELFGKMGQGINVFATFCQKGVYISIGSLTWL